MKVALYCRVSTDEQREKESIESQVEKLRRHCQVQNLEVHDFYLDDGVSGDISLPERPGGARLLIDARQQCFDRVLATRYDRLGRGKPSQTLQDIERLEDMGLPVECIEQWVDLADPNGVLMRLVHIGVARAEWMTTRKRSSDGTDRLAPTGQWLGGICPFGYKVDGYKRSARIVPSEDEIPGTNMSEADVIRFIYSSLVDEHRSCVWIGDYLNMNGIPPSYIRDSREIVRNKRKETTSGIWRASRIRNMVVNTTYKGLHVYGRRSKKVREQIEREVPALVSPEVWEAAQQQLTSNMLFSPRNATRKYLLRGMIKCGMCGLTYIGTSYLVKDGKKKSYYVCNGKHGARGIYGLNYQRCPSKSINAEIEERVWNDVESFLRNPGHVLEQLAAQMGQQKNEGSILQEEIKRLKGMVSNKDKERDTVVGLLRRGRIDETTLDRQLDEIAEEEKSLKVQVGQLMDRWQNIARAGERLKSAEDLLTELNRRLDQPLTQEIKRQLVETLVESVRVDTEGEGRQIDKRASVKVRYRFDEITQATNLTLTDSLPPPA